MDDRTRHQGDLFTRYEARIVALEIVLEDVRHDCEHYWPIVEQLRDGKIVADAVAKKLLEDTTLGMSKVNLWLMAAGLLVPAAVGPLVTVLLIKGHL